MGTTLRRPLFLLLLLSLEGVHHRETVSSLGAWILFAHHGGDHELASSYERLPEATLG